MGKIRVLVVDDAVVIRRLVTDVLNTDPDIEVVGSAANGRIALQKISQVNPDLITLDVEMPEMNGLETIVEIRKTWPTLPVIMFSTLTERGANTTLEALSLGATDYVTKPANVGSVTVAQQRVRDDLIPKVRALCSRLLPAKPAAPAAPAVSAGSAAPASPTAAARPLPGTVAAANPAPAASSPAAAAARPVISVSGGPKRVDVLAIGVSTGGPNALAEMLPELPADFPVPIVITQHMPPLFTRLLAERLTTNTKLTFREGFDGAKLTPGSAWIAPGDFHMVFERRGTDVIIRLNQQPQENSCRPAVDTMFRSVVDIYGAGTLGVILTGMGRDGLRGAELVKGVGGQVLAQDEASSVVWGMPGFVANAGLADAVLPLRKIAREVLNRVQAARLGGLQRKIA
ncbi:MAG: protein-glutamate methylesterase/protein-glutamine glutaminase [Gemmatimonas sp.]